MSAHGRADNENNAGDINIQIIFLGVELKLREPFRIYHLTITQAKCVWTQSCRAFYRLDNFFVCMAFHRLWYRQI